ncbi:unnamed protein product [Effrenium voratum]|nr:unnamed protein product [Effrenium voratum]
MAVAQRLLQCRYLRLVFRGRELEANSALEANLGHGDTIDAVAQQLEVASTDQAFALFVAGGPSPVLLWGNEIAGGYSNVRETRIKKIRGNLAAFAGIQTDGQVVTWGYVGSGGCCRALREQLTNVKQIQATDTAFAAIRADGVAVAWGSARDGGDSSPVQEQLKRVQAIQANRGAFAAIRDDGTVVTWGKADGGGDSAPVRERLTRVHQIQAAKSAFAAIRKDGEVVTWGDPDAGGDSSKVQHQLTQVQQIQATDTAFAAVRSDGTVVTWGNPLRGGESTQVQDCLQNSFERPLVKKTCACTQADFACDVGFVRQVGSMECVFGGSDMMPAEESTQNAPDTQLTLEWAYGYGAAGLHWISEDEFVFPVAALGVVQCLKPAKQKFFIGHSKRITCLSYCASARLCASGQMDPKGTGGPFICLWRPADCILLSVLAFPMHEEQICSLCFSPDGSQLFTMGRDRTNTLALWESFLPLKAGFPVSKALTDLPKVFRKPLAKVSTGKVPAFGMAASGSSANFQFATYDAGRDRSSGVLLKFWSVSQGELRGRGAIFPAAEQPRHVLNCAWIGAGTRCLACGDNGCLYIFEGNQAVMCQRISQQPLGFALEISEGELLLGAKNGVLHFAKLKQLERPERGLEVSSQPLHELPGAALLRGGRPLAFAAAAKAAAGKALLGSDNHHLVVLDAANRRLLSVPQLSHGGELQALCCHPDPQLQLLASGGTDACIRFWDAKEHVPVVGRILDFATSRNGAPPGVYSLGFSPSGASLAAGLGDGKLQWLRFPQLQGSACSLGKERLSALCFVEEEILVVGSWDQVVYLVNSSLRILRVMKGNSSSVTHMQITADRTFLMTNSKDGQVLYFNLATGERITQETTRDASWASWTCPMGWPTMGIWGANKSYSVTDVKCCQNLRSQGELLAMGDTSHCVKLFRFPALGNAGCHTYDAHGAFVTAMVPLPSAGEQHQHLVTAGGDDHAILQWRLAGPALHPDPSARTRAWHDEHMEEPKPVQLLRPSEARHGARNVAAALASQRPPWELDERPNEGARPARSKSKGSTPGAWVQHGNPAAPYAEHPEITERRSPGRAPGSTRAASGGVAGRSTEQLGAAGASRRAASASVSASAGPGAGVATGVREERRTFKQKGLFSGRDWVDQGAIHPGVASHAQAGYEQWTMPDWDWEDPPRGRRHANLR